MIGAIRRTVCIRAGNRRALYSGLYVRGRTLAEDRPADISEVAVLHGRIRCPERDLAGIAGTEMRAGDR